MSGDLPEMLKVASELLTDCAGYLDGDEVSKAQQQAQNYYFMRPRGDEQTGRSQVVSGVVSSMTEAVTSQMLDAFTSDSIAEFEPDGGEDEDSANLESDAVTAAIMDGNNGYVAFAGAIKNAVLLRNGIIKVGSTDAAPERERVYRNVTPEAYAELTRERKGIVLRAIDWAKGVLRISERRPRQRLTVESVATENFLYTKNWQSFDLTWIPCAGERHVMTRREMVDSWKFDAKQVSELTAYVPRHGAELARNPQSTGSTEQHTADPDFDQIEWYELYILAKGGERRRVCIVPNTTLLRDEPYFDVPYAIGVAILNPNRLLGVSLFDKLKQTQDIDTSFLRATIDNANSSNRNRTVFLEGRVNKADLEDHRVNGNVGVKVGQGVVDVRQAVAALQVNDLTAGLLANRQALKQDRSELGGASLDLATGQAQLTERVGSEGLDRAYSVMEQLAATMTRMVAETMIRRTYLLAHATMREFFDEPIMVRYRGRWVSSTPSEWPERNRVTIKVGMSPGERRRKLDALRFFIDAQLALGREGMTDVLVGMPQFYRALMDWGRTAEVVNPEQYFLDPESDESKKAQVDKRQAAQAEREAQKRLMNMALGMEQMRIAIDKRDGDLNRILDYFKAMLDAQKTQATVVGNAAKDFELQRRNAEAVAEQQERDATMLEGVDRATASLKELNSGRSSKTETVN